MDSSADPVRVERCGELTTIVLNRPEKRNALDVGMVETILAAILDAGQNGTRLLVLRGAGSDFCSGFDLSGIASSSDEQLAMRFIRIEQLLQALYHAPYETLALGQGGCFGAGVDLVCACSSRFAVGGASFLMPGLRFGVQLGSRRFAGRVGQHCATRILSASIPFDAPEAVRIGFLDGILDTDSWTVLIEARLRDASSLDAGAVARVRRAIVADTRAADMADLVDSLTSASIKQRLEDYLDRLRRPARA